ncbi:hypothetical protein L198_05241 [Cryptococcus wingfieldii CBS 7118]|uniref:Uncharacterized protein n=1 Tax=Cryptococcus wingfieldii CBS 7118 TaxID=1295528 RepID=A0A1E3IXN5_9TREE|nr:hypothetical protein L198_05241 [Cryptococcus wingfieldii CBS 7118]ODN93380.1 hypothetical protein L198_05241 [Cryptococcus wingfieldii CBS 7118]
MATFLPTPSSSSIPSSLPSSSDGATATLASTDIPSPITKRPIYFLRISISILFLSISQGINILECFPPGAAHSQWVFEQAARSAEVAWKGRPKNIDIVKGG